MDTNTRIVSAVMNMVSAIAAILGTDDIETTVTVNNVTILSEKIRADTADM